MALSANKETTERASANHNSLLNYQFKTSSKLSFQVVRLVFEIVKRRTILSKNKNFILRKILLYYTICICELPNVCNTLDSVSRFK